MKLSELCKSTGRTNAFLNSQEDLDWLFTTHIKDCNEDYNWIKENTKSFILIGNEDCPEFIECYNSHDPKFGAKPFFTTRGEDA